MIGQSLVFVCATFALVAGACFDSQISQGISTPVISTGCVSPVSSPVTSGSVLSLGSSVGCGLESSVLSSAGGLGSAVLSSAGGLGSAVLSSAGGLGSAVLSSAGGLGSAVLSSAGGLGSSVLSSGFGAGSSLLSSGLGAQITDGPQSTPITVVQAPDVTLPAVVSPIVPISTQPIPAPKVLSQRCVCTKTIVKPQVYQRTVTVPKIQRYLKRTVTPVVENISYKSTPISRGSSGSAVVSSGISSPSVLSAGVYSSPSVLSTGISSSQAVLSSGISSSPAVLSSGLPSSPAVFSSGISSSPAALTSGLGSCGSQVSVVSAPVIASAGLSRSSFPISSCSC